MKWLFRALQLLFLLGLFQVPESCSQDQFQLSSSMLGDLKGLGSQFGRCRPLWCFSRFSLPDSFISFLLVILSHFVEGSMGSATITAMAGAVAVPVVTKDRLSNQQA